MRWARSASCHPEATAAARCVDVAVARFVDEVEAGVSENMHFYKAGPDRSRALLNSRL